MARRLQRALSTWLRHEAAGREAAAEKALAGVFGSLPVPAPPADFALRVLAAAGIAAPAAPRWVWRVAIAICLALGAYSTTLVPRALAALGSLAASGRLAELATGVLAGIGQRVAWALAIWETLIGVAEALSSALSSPAMVGAAAAAALVSVGAFGVLRGLLDAKRSVTYVES